MQTHLIFQLNYFFFTVPDETQQNEEEIEQKRNKSRLRSQHYNILHNKAPYPEPFNDFHKTVKYQRKLYGAYGETSGVDPKICWPSAEDIANIQEYEKYKYPKTIQKMMQENEQKKKEFEEQRIKRQEDVAKKFAKLEQWKKELRDKVAKKESEARAIKVSNLLKV